MTNQELFDYVAVHLLEQGVKSEVDGQCCYKSESKSCAIGCLIPDELYTKDLEGKGVFNIVVQSAAGLTDENLPLAQVLQRIHDLENINHWIPKLSSAAFGFGLSYSVLKDYE